MNDPLIGRTIDGRYQLLQRIGEGGMGVVYRAQQVSVDRPVAIKMLSQQMANDPTWVQRFYNEAKACSRLQHPNTIRMFDFGQTAEGQLYMAMEFLDGQSLRQAIARGPMAPDRVLRILMQGCASLSEAHAIGIIHRDIKPDNVFLLNLPGSPDFVKLLDFSVAKLLQENEKMRTQAGVVFGTPQYMSPEQGRGLPLDPRSDIYALGILAFEMLSARVPFTDDNPMTVLQMHLRQPVPPLPDWVPAGVRTVVNKALEKDPNHRYQSVVEMMQHCQQVLGQLGAPPGQAPGPAPAHQQKTMMAGQAPDVQALLRAQQGAPPPAAGPPPAAAGPPPGAPVAAAEQKTMLAGQAPDVQALLRAQQQGAPAYAAPGPQPGFGPPDAMKTVVGNLGAMPGTGPPGAPPLMPAAGPPGMPPGPSGRADGVPQKTMLLDNSEGILSFTNRAASAPVLAPTEDELTGATDAGGGPSALFWTICLVTGLAAGIGAYVLVLQLG